MVSGTSCNNLIKSLRMPESVETISTSLGPPAFIEAPLPKPSVFRVYLDPKEPTFLGLLLMISLYKSLKR